MRSALSKAGGGGRRLGDGSGSLGEPGRLLLLLGRTFGEMDGEQGLRGHATTSSRREDPPHQVISPDSRGSPRRRRLESGGRGVGVGRLGLDPTPLTPASLSRVRRSERERGGEQGRSQVALTAALPRPAGTAPRTGHRKLLPRPRVSPAFFAPSFAFTQWDIQPVVPLGCSRRPSIAGRVHVLAQSSTGSKMPGARCN